MQCDTILSDMLVEDIGLSGSLDVFDLLCALDNFIVQYVSNEKDYQTLDESGVNIHSNAPTNIYYSNFANVT